MSETVGSKLLWSAIGSLIGTGINFLIGFLTHSFNYPSVALYISVGLAALACILFGIDIVRRQKRHEVQTEIDRPQQEQQERQRRERRFRFFPANP